MKDYLVQVTGTHQIRLAVRVKAASEEEAIAEVKNGLVCTATLIETSTAKDLKKLFDKETK